MKVLRSTEWEPVAWMETFPSMGTPVYVFLNKKYGDVVALKVAKYVDVPHDNVYLYNAQSRSISLSCDETEYQETSLPKYNVQAV